MIVGSNIRQHLGRSCVECPACWFHTSRAGRATVARPTGWISHSDNSDWLIEHIGSIAIPGMPAKPIIDLTVRILVQVQDK
jgi:hypothetical protein